MGKPGTDFGKVIDSILDRLDAIEKARANEVQWVKSKIKIEGVPNSATSDRSVTAWWVLLDTANPPQNVWLALDDAVGEVIGPYPETRLWSDLAPGKHSISAFIDGKEVARETWFVKE